jgi:hypothetical protein
MPGVTARVGHLNDRKYDPSHLTPVVSRVILIAYVASCR